MHTLKDLMTQEMNKKYKKTSEYPSTYVPV